MAVNRLRRAFQIAAAPSLLVLSTVLGVAGCASVRQPVAVESGDKAVLLLRQSAEAQGLATLRQLHDVNVRFEEKWNGLAARFQPVLVDDRFRITSEERYLVNEPVVGQTYTGPGGVKYVFRDPPGVRVWYNDQENQDAQVRDAAALVADSYRMLLLGPGFFLQRGATWGYLGTEEIDGMECDQVQAVLKPGIGNSEEDSVVVSIDRERHWVRRVRMTPQGFQGTRGDVVDIFLRDPVRLHGVVWPTSFYEELKRPFDVTVHRWRLTAIDFDRGLGREMLDGRQFSGAATRPAGPGLASP
jgi:hypothetical protein